MYDIWIDYFKSSYRFNLMFSIEDFFADIKIGIMICLFNRSFKLSIIMPDVLVEWRGAWRLIKSTDDKKH
jgi:hypothetical protein